MPSAYPPDYSRPGDKMGADPPDQEARLRIRNDLNRNYLVEAGAGSGKTTALVDRMVALVRGGACTVGKIAAVTFTRMAAAELRQRFQVALEGAEAELDQARSQSRGGAQRIAEKQRLRAAIQDIDQAFLGTIHSFCAKLLRERPLEAGLDPGFREVQETEEYRSRQQSWTDFLERVAAEGDARLHELKQLGIPVTLLRQSFDNMVDNPDVDFVHERVDPPDPAEVARLRADLDGILDRAAELMKGRKPKMGWDSVGKRARTLLYWRRSQDWQDQARLFDAVAKFHLKKGKVTQNRWADTYAGKQEAKRLGLDIEEFGAAGGNADRLLRHWWAYRYPTALGFSKAAADAYKADRNRRGEVTYQDLLVLSADLLHKDPEARRELGRRYSHVLVDEFQDTDPLQAKILLLLASDPETSGNDWRYVQPRPGALFVVGDPKQSIYRFRRADISLYEVVKRRFEQFGEVLHLDANFRSLAVFGELVEGVFHGKSGFPMQDSESQAAYAPLVSRTEGTGLVTAYPVKGNTQDELARDDAARIASEIARRVAAAQRNPGDFMILTRTRRHLSVYARALEDRGLPVEVSGTGVGFEDELRAFLSLFRCMADPAHAIHVLAVLAGPLFGLSPDRIARYRANHGRLEINGAPAGDCEVAQAIGVLHKWWLIARREPADVTAERLVAANGLFPLAGAGSLGEVRAGGLAYLVDAVRARALAGDSSLAGALDAMETALAWEDAEAPLIPGRPDCVRVMNLHRAKGLEADVVFLAAPFGVRDWPPRMHVARDRKSDARGSIPIIAQRSQYVKETIAQPLDWEESARREKAFEKAEQVRLLYVAATRAKHELWIAQGKRPPKRVGPSPWGDLEKWVARRARGRMGPGGRCVVLDSLPIDAPPVPDRLDPSTDVSASVAAAAGAVDRNREATYRLDTVTARAKAAVGVRGAGGVAAQAGAEEDFARPAELPASGGIEWGSVVHGVLASAADGSRGAALEHVARDLLIEHERPVNEKGVPTELSALLELVAAVRGSAIWGRAMASNERHNEIPFALSRKQEGDRPEVVEGVIDLVFKEANHWVMADYKTDRGDDPDYGERVRRYRKQVDLYAECWERLTGEPVGERALIFTAQGKTESW